MADNPTVIEGVWSRKRLNKQNICNTEEFLLLNGKTYLWIDTY